MAKNDIVLKKYMSDTERFADLVNGSLFDGTQIVKPENLTQIPGESDVYFVAADNKKKYITRYRDVIMKADFGLYFVVIAEENQMKVHYAMPIRNMLYDALSYTEQVEQIKKEHHLQGEKLTDDEFLSGMKKEDKIIPVITLVIYYGEKEWDGNLDLYGMMGLDSESTIIKEIKSVLPNYKINLIHAGNIDKLENYKSSLQLVFGMLKYKSDKCKLKEYLIQNRASLEAMDEETYHVISVLLHEEERLKKYKKQNEVGLSMCRAIDEMIQDGRNEGRAEGIEAGIHDEQLRIAKELKGFLSDEIIAEKTNLPLEIVNKL